MEMVSTAQLKRPPQTKGLPLVGSIPTALKEQLDFLDHAQQIHGDVYKIDLGPTSIVMLCNPAYAQYVLRDNVKNFSKGGPMWDSVRTLVGNGLVVSAGDFWMRQRRMMQPQFHRQHLAGMTSLMIDAITAGMQSWDGHAADRKPVEMLQLFNHITMKVIVQTMFGKDLADSDADVIGHEMSHALDFMLQNMVTQIMPNWMPVPGRKRYQQSIVTLDAFINRITSQRRQLAEQPTDMMGMLLQMIDDESGEAMTDKQIRDEIATLFLAGYETTSLTMTWGVHQLLQHPEVIQRLQLEVDTALKGQLPTFETLEKLPYARMVIQEIMRLYPPAFWLPRTAVEADEIGGYHIEAGQMIGVSIYNIQRNPSVWDDPQVFDPERFAPDNSAKRHALAFMPFGAGQRMCIGRDFAMLEGMLILSMLMQRYDLISVERTTKPMFSTTLRPKGGVWAKLAKRTFQSQTLGQGPKPANVE